MSVANPAFKIARRPVTGEQNEFVKMFDPPNASPATPELISLTPANRNPVPEFMVAQGLSAATPGIVRRTLLNAINHTAFDGTLISNFFTLADTDLIGPFAAGHYPAATIRVPRGKLFHGETQGKTGPHTIHWHGIEPTPINDGVGHCSMEIGAYTYQWKPNFIGSYFYHCHRNTVQHFEFGLFGFLIIEPPDAYDPSVPINPGGPPKTVGGYPRRTAANLAKFPQFPGFNSNPIESMDPHAFTVPYDVEALWVLDDIDARWHSLAPSPFSTFPAKGSIPGQNDNFHGNIANGFFAFNNYNPNYFTCTGLNFEGPVGNPAPAPLQNTVAAFGGDGSVPAALNSGVAGMQVAVNAKVGQTVLIRSLCAAYVPIKITFPVDVVIIAFDGRALGVPPWNQYNSAFTLKAGTPYELSTARRFDALIKVDKPVNSFANVEFRHNSGGKFLLNGRIPININ